MAFLSFLRQVVGELLVGSRNNLNFGNPQWHEEPEGRTIYHIIRNFKSQYQKYCLNFRLKDTKPENEVDDLNPTEDGESSEKAHCASNQTKLRLCGYLENNYQVGNTN